MTPTIYCISKLSCRRAHADDADDENSEDGEHIYENPTEDKGEAPVGENEKSAPGK